MTEPNPYETPPETPRSASANDWMAMAALVLGMMSCGVSCITGIPAITLGMMALRSASDKARPLALTGMALGIFNTLAGILMLGITVILGMLTVGTLLGDALELPPPPPAYGDHQDTDT